MSHARKPRPEARDVALPDAHNRLLAEKRLSPSDAIDRVRVTVNLAERSLGWPSRAGKLVLLLALDRLDTHYTRGGR
ncbi:hypothetical protein EUV02_10460 [Polymorphobacter arshaanensis]|uniref:DUF6456 domain-containing protein n=1 Tax=Glacieibacterium arshaanense TaxID=2511025 RepID=A0A4Y9ENE7_9SPHN|nr:hypothetical protein EUV02_10460 [Polymorphobacter arshaanensis]